MSNQCTTAARILALVAVSLLSSSAAHAFRTAADLPEFSDTERVGWPTGVTSFSVTRNYPPGLLEADVLQSVRDGIGVWNGVACSELSVGLGEVTDVTPAPNDGINSIAWVTDGWAELDMAGKDAAGATDIAYARDENDQWTIVEADIYLNAEDHQWSAGPLLGGEYRDVLSVVAHEVGHALGLLHPCEAKAASGVERCDELTGSVPTMSPVYDPEQSTLAVDDQAGLCFLYPVEGTAPELCDESSCAEGFVCIDGTCEPQAPCRGSDCEGSCERDSDCASGARCESSVCVGQSPLGDPCSDDGTCRSKLCSDQGFCVDACENSPGAAGASGESTARCVVAQEPLGGPCDRPSDCLGGECLEGFTPEPVCTRRCGNGCPASWECATVDEVEVCIPVDSRVAVKGGGCTFRFSGSENTTPVGWLALALVAMRLRRRLGSGANAEKNARFEGSERQMQ